MAIQLQRQSGRTRQVHKPASSQIIVLVTEIVLDTRRVENPIFLSLSTLVGLEPLVVSVNQYFQPGGYSPNFGWGCAARFSKP